MKAIRVIKNPPIPLAYQEPSGKWFEIKAGLIILMEDDLRKCFEVVEK